jgi:hypothetical protein
MATGLDREKIFRRFTIIVRPLSIMTTREYYSYQIHFVGHTHNLLWYSDDIDGLVLDETGKLATFATRTELATYAAAHGITSLKNTNASLDLDLVVRWCEYATATSIDCNRLLDAWNFFTDLANSIAQVATAFVGSNREYSPINEKLFYGCNLPVITPEGMHYTPSWTMEELAGLVIVLRSGLEDIQAHLP